MHKTLAWTFVGMGMALAPACGSKNDSAPAADAGAGEGGDAGGCVDTGDRPSGRADAMGVYDAKRRRLVFFGGDTGVPIQCMPAPKLTAELWTYDVDCKLFAKVDFTDGPGARTRGVAIYDPDGDRMIVFGGRARAASSGPYTLFNETWSLDLAQMTWSKLTTTGTPPSARASAAGAYDPTTKELVIFGGNTSTSGLSFTPLADAWALNLATGAWRAIATTGAAPAARLFHTAAIDPNKHELFVYSGGDANAFTGPFLKDLWSLDLGSGAWEELDAGGATSPSGRINASSTFDAKTGRFVFFGGHDDGAVGNENETWSFDPATKAWTNVVPPETVKTMPPSFCLFPKDFTTPNTHAPDRRSSAVAALDVAGGLWTIFGGSTDCGLIDDVWTFDLSKNTWASPVTARVGEACLRGANPQQCTTLCQ